MFILFPENSRFLICHEAFTATMKHGLCEFGHYACWGRWREVAMNAFFLCEMKTV